MYISVYFHIYYFKVKAAQFDIVKHIRQDMISIGLENAISTGTILRAVQL